MTTKLYFHNALTADTGTLPTTVQSALGVPALLADAATVNRSMDTTIGAAQASLALTPGTAQNKLYYTRFVSSPLNMTSITAQTWNFAFAAKQGATTGAFPTAAGASNHSLNVTVYVWRPGTGAKVGNILDGASTANFGYTPASTVEASEFGTFAGAALTIASLDILCIEIYFNLAAHASTQDTFYYDGTTETNANGTTVSNHASYIETPQALTFAGGVTLNRTVFIEWMES